MIEPVALQDFFVTFFSAALIILTGAAYALLFAWSKFNRHWGIRYTAYLCYGFLVAAVAVLSHAAHFSGLWLTLSLMMTLGYFFAPRGIWALCVKTHAD